MWLFQPPPDDPPALSRWWKGHTRLSAITLVFATINALYCILHHKPILAAINSTLVIILASNLRIALSQWRKYQRLTRTTTP